MCSTLRFARIWRFIGLPELFGLAAAASICSNSSAAPYTLQQLATICDETFAVTNATGFYSFDPGLFTSNFSGPSPNITFVQTLYAAINSAAAAVRMDTGSWDFANDVALGYDACAIRIDGLTEAARYNALHSDELASNTADSLVINGKDQSQPTHELGLVCQNMQDTINANFPSSCSSYYNSSAFLVASGEPLTGNNYTNSDESCVNNPRYGCTLNKTYWAIAGQREHSGNGVSFNEVYDTMAHTVFQVLTIFFSVANEYRSTVNPAQAHLACLHVANFTAGSRVAPPFPSSSSDTLGGGQITGIVIGSVFGALLIAGLGFWWWRSRGGKGVGPFAQAAFWKAWRSQTKIGEAEELSAPGELPGDLKKSELSASHAVPELSGDHRKRAELNAEYPPTELPANNKILTPYPDDRKESMDTL